MKIGSKRIHYKNITSTNYLLKQHSSEFKHGTIITADLQNKGRGRKKRKWVSGKGGLYLSILLKPQHLSRIEYLNYVATLSVVKALKYLCRTKIRRPNDVYLNGKKLGGVLLESRYADKLEYVVVGIGVNVNQTRFPQYLTATSLRRELHQEFSVEKILKAVLQEFNIYYSLLEQGKYPEIAQEFNENVDSSLKSTKKASRLEVSTPPVLLNIAP